MRTAIYPGTFDPPTVGHLDVARRAAHLFDRLVFAVVATRGSKAPLFSAEERVEFARIALAEIPNIVVDSIDGLTVDYARRMGAVAMVRGLRAVSDFEFEFPLAYMNARLAPEIESVFIMTSSEYAYVSSSLIREVAALGGDVSGLVPPVIEAALQERFGGHD